LSQAFTLLPGGSIDLDGASGPLDFQPNSGDVDADMEMECITTAGNAASSGAFYRYASAAFEGHPSCP